MAVIVNIDQCVAFQQDLSFFLALKYASKERRMPSDVKILQHQPNYVLPSDFSYLSDQMFTQEEMNVTVLLYLNDIEEIMSSEILKESLYCIQCGRCLEVCPVASCHDNLSPIVQPEQVWEPILLLCSILFVYRFQSSNSMP